MEQLFNYLEKNTNKHLKNDMEKDVKIDSTLLIELQNLANIKQVFYEKGIEIDSEFQSKIKQIGPYQLDIIMNNAVKNNEIFREDAPQGYLKEEEFNFMEKLYCRMTYSNNNINESLDIVEYMISSYFLENKESMGLWADVLDIKIEKLYTNYMNDKESIFSSEEVPYHFPFLTNYPDSISFFDNLMEKLKKIIDGIQIIDKKQKINSNISEDSLEFLFLKKFKNTFLGIVNNYKQFLIDFPSYISLIVNVIQYHKMEEKMDSDNSLESFDFEALEYLNDKISLELIELSNDDYEISTESKDMISKFDKLKLKMSKFINIENKKETKFKTSEVPKIQNKIIRKTGENYKNFVKWYNAYAGYIFYEDLTGLRNNYISIYNNSHKKYVTNFIDQFEKGILEYQKVIPKLHSAKSVDDIIKILNNFLTKGKINKSNLNELSKIIKLDKRYKIVNLYPMRKSFSAKSGILPPISLLRMKIYYKGIIATEAPILYKMSKILGKPEKVIQFIKDFPRNIDENINDFNRLDKIIKSVKSKDFTHFENKNSKAEGPYAYFLDLKSKTINILLENGFFEYMKASKIVLNYIKTKHLMLRVIRDILSTCVIKLKYLYTLDLSKNKKSKEDLNIPFDNDLIEDPMKIHMIDMEDAELNDYSISFEKDKSEDDNMPFVKRILRKTNRYSKFYWKEIQRYKKKDIIQHQRFMEKQGSTFIQLFEDNHQGMTVKELNSLYDDMVSTLTNKHQSIIKESINRFEKGILAYQKCIDNIDKTESVDDLVSVFNNFFTYEKMEKKDLSRLRRFIKRDRNNKKAHVIDTHRIDLYTKESMTTQGEFPNAMAVTLNIYAKNAYGNLQSQPISKIIGDPKKALAFIMDLDNHLGFLENVLKRFDSIVSKLNPKYFEKIKFDKSIKPINLKKNKLNITGGKEYIGGAKNATAQKEKEKIKTDRKYSQKNFETIKNKSKNLLILVGFKKYTFFVLFLIKYSYKYLIMTDRVTNLIKRIVSLLKEKDSLKRKNN